MCETFVKFSVHDSGHYTVLAHMVLLYSKTRDWCAFAWGLSNLALAENLISKLP